MSRSDLDNMRRIAPENQSDKFFYTPSQHLLGRSALVGGVGLKANPSPVI